MSEPEGRYRPQLIAIGALVVLAAFWAGYLSAHEPVRDQVSGAAVWLVTDGALWLAKTAVAALMAVVATVCVNKVRRWWRRSHQ
ncbi:hypothetical protein OG453_38890 [Streptomyces sp. NBC_01381]|uniref:hypothetical protein n=1 Tax=Streptomyces sp. NBC_01381 TaxID=2903845 RepID=UPI0022510678|nr:hypothetical protein [Streptomyces sp. NBC_01381]MCX4672546.1 hypothetical protein [Streptomyces sp. NBC_01381]